MYYWKFDLKYLILCEKSMNLGAQNYNIIMFAFLLFLQFEIFIPGQGIQFRLAQRRSHLNMR